MMSNTEIPVSVPVVLELTPVAPNAYPFGVGFDPLHGLPAGMPTIGAVEQLRCRYYQALLARIADNRCAGSAAALALHADRLAGGHRLPAVLAEIGRTLPDADGRIARLRAWWLVSFGEPLEHDLLAQIDLWPHDARRHKSFSRRG